MAPVAPASSTLSSIGRLFIRRQRGPLHRHKQPHREPIPRIDLSNRIGELDHLLLVEMLAQSFELVLRRMRMQNSKNPEESCAALSQLYAPIVFKT